MEVSRYLYIGLGLYLLTVLYYQAQLDERDRLVDYYRQPGGECTVGEEPIVVASPVPATITWHADEGRLVFMLTHPSEVLVYVPEEDGEWVRLERDSDFVRSRQLHRLTGRPRILLKWRLETASLVN